MEIDIGVWRVILAIGGEGGVVGQVGVVGLGSAAGSQIKYLRVERFVQLLRKVGRFTQGAFVGCREVLGRAGLGGFGLRLLGLVRLILGRLCLVLGRPSHLCFGRRLGGLPRSTDKGKEAYQY